MSKIPNIIINNPYRILGVYANSPRANIVANESKAKAFLRVNKPVEYPLDLNGILPPVSRTLNMMNAAVAHLAIAKEQIKNAQFWFLKMTPIDDKALEHLVAGDMEKAKEIWSRKESQSSLQNKVICFLIEEKYRAAVIAAEKLYKLHGSNYIKEIDPGCTLQMSETELLSQFIKILGAGIGIQKVLNYIQDEDTKAYLRDQVIGPLMNKISSEIEKTKKVDRDDASARIAAARALVKTTKEPFAQLRNICSFADSQYQMIADKLGLEILQCGIDYFIGMRGEDEEAPFTAMKMLKYANTIVVGKIAKDRCEDQIKELQKYIDNLPPKEVIAEDKVIKEELAKYVRLPDKISHAITLLNNTKPQLQRIKQKLGGSNAYYMKLSTQIVGNALHNVVEEVNEAQKSETIKLQGISLSLDDLLSPEQRLQKLNRIKNTVREAWKAATLMDEFDLEADFKSYYTKNRNTLESMCNDLEISTYVSSPSTDTRSTTSSTTTGTNTPNPSTEYSSSTPKAKKEAEMNPIVAIAIIHVIWGLFGLSEGIGGFFGAMFAGIAGWIIPINYAAYAIIEWIYKQMNE